jgi:hypothetical protein
MLKPGVLAGLLGHGHEVDAEEPPGQDDRPGVRRPQDAADLTAAVEGVADQYGVSRYTIRRAIQGRSSSSKADHLTTY